MISQTLSNDTVQLRLPFTLGIGENVPIWIISHRNPSTIWQQELVKRVHAAIRQGIPMGLDTETVEVEQNKYMHNRVELLQLYIPETVKAETLSESYHGVYLVHGNSNIENFGKALLDRGIHALPVIAHNARFEIQVLSRVSFPFVEARFDTMNTPTVGPRSLQSLTTMCFGVTLCKDNDIRNGNWASELSEHQIHYAALDAVATYALWKLYREISSKVMDDFSKSGLLDRAYQRLMNCSEPNIDPRICTAEMVAWVDYLVTRLEEVNFKIETILQGPNVTETLTLLIEPTENPSRGSVQCLSLQNLEFAGISPKMADSNVAEYPFPDDFFRNPLRDFILNCSTQGSGQSSRSIDRLMGSHTHEVSMDQFLHTMYETTLSKLWLERAILIKLITKALVGFENVSELEMAIRKVLEPQVPCVNSHGESFLVENPWLEIVQTGRDPSSLAVKSQGRQKPFCVLVSQTVTPGNQQLALYESPAEHYGPQLRPDQRRAVKELLRGRSDAILQGPTGSGKTVTTLCFALEMLISGGCKIGIITAPNDTLASQWYKEYLDKFPSEIPAILVKSREKLEEFPEPCFVFCTFNTASRILSQLPAPVRLATFVVIDEIHKACGKSYGGELITTAVNCEVKMVIGVSATPRKEEFVRLLGNRGSKIRVVKLDAPHRISQGKILHVGLSPFERYLEKVFFKALESARLSWEGSYKALLEERNKLTGASRLSANEALAAYNLLKISLSGGQAYLEETMKRLRSEINPTSGVKRLLDQKKRELFQNHRAGKNTPGLHLEIFLLEHWYDIREKSQGHTQEIIRQIVEDSLKKTDNSSVIVAGDSVPCAQGLEAFFRNQGYETHLFTGKTGEPKMVDRFLQEPAQVMFMTQAGFEGLNLKGRRFVMILPGLLDSLLEYVQGLGRVRDELLLICLIPETPIYSAKYSLLLEALKEQDIYVVD